MVVEIKNEQLNLSVVEKEVKLLIASIVGETLVNSSLDYGKLLEDNGLIESTRNNLMKNIEKIKQTIEECYDNKYILEEINGGVSKKEYDEKGLVELSIFKKNKLTALIIYSVIATQIQDDKKT